MTTRLNPDAKEFVPTFLRSRQDSPNTDVLFMSTSFGESEDSIGSQGQTPFPEEVSYASENVYLDEDTQEALEEVAEAKEEFYVCQTEAYMTNPRPFRSHASSGISERKPYEKSDGSNSYTNAHMGDGDHRTKFLERPELQTKTSKMQKEDLNSTSNESTKTIPKLEKRTENDKKVTITTAKLSKKLLPDGPHSHRCACNSPKASTSNTNLPSSQRPRTAPMSGRICDASAESNLKTSAAVTNLKTVPGPIQEVKVGPLHNNKVKVSTISTAICSSSSSRPHVETRVRPATSEAHSNTDTTAPCKPPQNQPNNVRKPVLPRATVAFTLRRNEAMKKKNLIPGNTGKI